MWIEPSVGTTIDRPGFISHYAAVHKENSMRVMQVRAKTSGFTLIELMIVVVVIAVLLSLAVPAYDNYRMRAARRAAQATMLDMANRAQQYFLDNRAFPNDAAQMNYVAPREVSDRYQVPLGFAPDNAATPPCFTIAATATGRQVPDGDMTLDCRGTKTRGGVEGW
jgi:type IV pilus assembly protein PilE